MLTKYYAEFTRWGRPTDSHPLCPVSVVKSGYTQLYGHNDVPSGGDGPPDSLTFGRLSMGVSTAGRNHSRKSDRPTDGTEFCV